MSLEKMVYASKKARREHKRQQKRNNIAKHREHNRIRRKRAQDMFIQGRKEYQAKRRADKDYIDQLERELSNETSPTPPQD